VVIQRKKALILNNNMKMKIFWLVIILIVSNVCAQTTEWKVVWDKNAPTDSVEYYTIYRNIDSAPGFGDNIGTVPQPTNAGQDSVLYIDQNINPGVHYYYSIQAVDSSQRTSSLSSSADAAIPRILINSNITVPSNTTTAFSLNDAQYVQDPDNNYNQLDWSVSGGNQISVSINSSNTITIVTPEDTTIQETFEFSVADPDRFYHIKSVTISLTRVNSLPQITSLPSTTVIKNDPYQYNVNATDADGDPLTFSLIQAPDFLNIAASSSSSAIISGIPNDSDVGGHQVRILVEDEFGGSDTQNYVLTVQDTIGQGDFHTSIQVTAVQEGIMQIGWQTIESSRDYIEYGSDQNYGSSTTPESNLTTDHEQQISGLASNTLYHFQIVSENSSGTIYRSSDAVFMTPGGPNNEEKVRAFPVPYNANSPSGSGGINFEMPSSSDLYSLLIYNILGDLVFNISDVNGTYLWNVTNSAGNEINAGLYIYVVNKKNGDQVGTGKVVIIR
jgi:hypothetical protein